ncbi:MAG: CopG family antitoxin [Polynucleobacter sp.]|nr:CopG family antitoxin [Polynucleobacter sp.]
MRKPTKVIPKFASEAQERAYWETHNSTEHLDWTAHKPLHMGHPSFRVRQLFVQSA